MHRLTRHLRGFAIAGTALVLTAGAVLAHATPTTPPAAAADGLKRAAEAAGKTVPVRTGWNKNAAPAQGTSAASTTSTVTAGTTSTPTTSDRPHNHGWFVSQAAQATTPTGFKNHGAYVSSIAKSAVGKPPSAGGASTNGAINSAAGKAKAAANRAGKGNH